MHFMVRGEIGDRQGLCAGIFRRGNKGHHFEVALKMVDKEALDMMKKVGANICSLRELYRRSICLTIECSYVGSILN